MTTSGNEQHIFNCSYIFMVVPSNENKTSSDVATPFFTFKARESCPETEQKEIFILGNFSLPKEG